MVLDRYKLGEVISLCEERNTEGIYTLEDLKGISIKKVFIETKADMQDVSLSPYFLVRPDSFVYVPVTSRNGEKITLAHNTSNQTYIVSSSYIVFRVIRPDILLSDYLFMFFNRPEFDRYSRFNSWGSARETFSWEDFCDIEITLPSIKTQQKFVNVYFSLQKNLEAYQSSLDDLKMAYEGYIENLRRTIKPERIGKYIHKEDKNTDNKIDRVLGIGKEGFILPQKDPNESLRNYNIMRKGDICYAPPLYNILTGALHCYSDSIPAVCSPIYEVFTCDEDKLIPEYLTLWLKRKEFIRYAEFFAQGVRQTFDYSLMEDIQIPIPDINIQKAITQVYSVYNERKAIAARLKEQLNTICPILIRGSILTEK